MTERAEQMGVQMMFECPVKKILMEDGRAVGVACKNDDGEEFEVRADVVMIGTNGFSDNKEMEKETLGEFNFPHGKGFTIPGLTGDGQRMLFEVGVAKVKAEPEWNTQSPGITDIFKTLGETSRQFDLIVDVTGRRFMNELVQQHTTNMANIIFTLPEKKCFTILTDEIIEYYKKHGPENVTPQHRIYNLDNWDFEVDACLRGDVDAVMTDESLGALHEDDHTGFWVCDSLEEVCEKAGIHSLENLKATIERYNKFAGLEDPDFYKPAQYMKAVNPGGKYYVFEHWLVGPSSHGGVMTDEWCRAVTQDKDVIPGLYCIGIDACNINGPCYHHECAGANIGFALVSATLASQDAGRYLDELDAAK